MEESQSSISSEIQQWSNAKIALLIFIAGMILFIAGLSVYRFDESSIRYATYCMEMKDHPISWFPYLNGSPDHHLLIPYPLLAYWSSQIFGGKINMFTVSLPSSVCGALSLMLIYLIGAREKREIGLYALLLTIGSYYFISLARTPSPAMFTILSTLIAYYIFIHCQSKKSWFAIIIPLTSVFLFSDKTFEVLSIVIPFAALYLGKLFWNEKNIQWVDKCKEKFFYVIRFAPFTLMLCWWLVSYRLQQDKSLSPLPVMIPSMILLVCGMGMFAAKELKESTRQLVMTAALVMSIYTTKIMIIDPVSMAFDQKQPGISQNVR